MSKKDVMMFKQLNEKSNTCISICSQFADNRFILESLSEKEYSSFLNLHGNIKKKEFLIGRYSAKCAVSELAPDLSMNDICVKSGIFGEPLIDTYNTQRYFVSISHKGNVSVAIASNLTGSIGIDLEYDNKNRFEAIELVCSEKERKKFSPDGLHMILWTAKEALSKLFKTGLMTNFQIFEIDSIQLKNGVWHGTYSYFTQFEFQTIVLCGYVLTIVLPAFIDINIDKKGVKLFFETLQNIGNTKNKFEY